MKKNRVEKSHATVPFKGVSSKTPSADLAQPSVKVLPANSIGLHKRGIVASRGGCVDPKSGSIYIHTRSGSIHIDLYSTPDLVQSIFIYN